MKASGTARTKPISSIVAKPLVEDKGFQGKVEEFLKGLRVEQKLIRLRKEQGLSQNQFAKMLGVSQPFIAKLESGHLTNIELKTLARMVFALNGSLELRIKPNKSKSDPAKKSIPAHASSHR